MICDSAFVRKIVKLNTKSPTGWAAKAEEAVAIIEGPPELSAAARKEWDRIPPALAALGRLTELDRASLAMVLKSPTGYPVQSPYVSISAKHAEHSYQARGRVRSHAGKQTP